MLRQISIFVVRLGTLISLWKFYRLYGISETMYLLQRAMNIVCLGILVRITAIKMRKYRLSCLETIYTRRSITLSKRMHVFNTFVCELKFAI